MRAVTAEIATQPALWRRAAGLCAEHASRLPAPGERVAVIGCGTSLYMAQAFAAARDAAGLGDTDAFAASELPPRRRYDRVLAISRSGTTTVVAAAVRAVRPGTATTAVVAVDRTPVTEASEQAVVLDFADERSVVQTRFATTALALLLTHVGHDVERAALDAERVLNAAVPLEEDGAGPIVFLGRGWTVGLANEAALKLREAAGAWSESYPAMEYRHGPISLAREGSAVWAMGDVDASLLDEVRRTGARVVDDGVEPMASLVAAQRLAVALAERRGLDPDRPRNLARSVVLDGG
jgi:fructoselysine-6-P-deglycase FrlB-like protein